MEDSSIDAKIAIASMENSNIDAKIVIDPQNN